MSKFLSYEDRMIIAERISFTNRESLLFKIQKPVKNRSFWTAIPKVLIFSKLLDIL